MNYPWVKPEADLPPPDCVFGWSSGVLVYDPREDEEDFYVGAYSHHLKKWQVCGTTEYRACTLWTYVETPTA